MFGYRKLVAAAALATLAPPAARAQSAADTRPTVFISYFTNGAIGRNNADLQPLSKGIADMLITEMQANPAIRVVERSQLEELFREQNLSAGDRVSDATAVQMGKTLGAHHMIAGVYVTDTKNNMRLALRVVNVETSQVEYSAQLQRTTDDVLDLVTQLAAKTNREMRLPAITPAPPRRTGDAGAASGTTTVAAAGAIAPPVAEKPPIQVSKDEPEARAAAKPAKPKKVPFEAVLLYSKGLAEADKGNREQAVELYRQALSRFPDYAAPRKELARLEKNGD